MAWNGSNQSAIGNARLNKLATPQKKLGRQYHLIYAVIAMSLAFVLGFITVFYFSAQPSDKHENEKPRKETARIPESLPNCQSSTRTVKEPEKPTVVGSKSVKTEKSKSADELPTDEASIMARIDAQYAKRGVRRIFHHNTDTFLSQYVIPGQNSPPPPWDARSKDEFLNSLLDPIVITDEDNEQERELKEGVRALRDDLVKWLDKGGTFEDYVNNLQERQDHEAMIVAEAKKFINQTIMEAHDIDEAVELWRATNKKLEEEGLRRMKLPVRLRLAMKRQHLEVPEE